MAERRLVPNMAGHRAIRKFQTYPSRGFSRGSEIAYLTSPISPIFLHVRNLQRRAGRLFETARLRQTKSIVYCFVFCSHCIMVRAYIISLYDHL